MALAERRCRAPARAAQSRGHAEEFLTVLEAPRSLRGRARQALQRCQRWSGLPTTLGLLLAVHLGFGLVRFPAGAIHKRLEAVRDWQERGVDGWCFRLADAETRRVARWLREQVRADDLVRFDGDWRGSMQLLAPILFPALLVHDGSAKDWPVGRPVFAARAPWLAPPAGTHPVVVATIGALRLEYR